MKFTDSLKTKTFIFSVIAIVSGTLTITPEQNPTIDEWITAGAAILVIASGRQAIGKSAAGKARAIIAGLVLGGLAFLLPAGAVAAPPVTPYVALTADRLSGPDEWSTGFEAGAEATQGKLYVYGSISLQDVLSTRDVYPWDSTFRLGAGVYSQTELFGIPATPYAGLRLARPSRPTEWSFGIELGNEIAFDPIWIRLGIEFNDWLSERQVFPWDTTLRLGVGFYFAEPEEGDAGGARGTRARQR